MDNFNRIAVGIPTKECLIHCEGVEKAFTEEVSREHTVARKDNSDTRPDYSDIRRVNSVIVR